MRSVRSSRVIVSVFVAVVTVLLLLPTTAGASTGRYVALGDSYTAGPLIPNQILSATGCLRSDHNYPHLIANAIAPSSFADASCSGATTNDMTHTQNVTGGSNAPQFDRLTSATALVTLEIGGNDIGFSDIVKSCATAWPFGSPCKDKFDENGVDQIAARISTTAPKIAATIDAIHVRAPNARVFVLGYLAILPDSGSGCWPKMPIAWNDVPFLRAKEKQLNGMIASQAAAHGATYVDIYTPSISHSACADDNAKWVEPIVPTHLAAPVHPNATGESHMASLTRAAMGL
jgi:lysophospholipase L1-like esterase